MRPLHPLLCLPVLFLVACSDSAHPSASVVGPEFLILDGAHNDGNSNVFLLPPLVSAPNPLGVFDPNLTPRVEICLADLTLTACAEAPFLVMVFGSGDEGVRLVAEEELYQANWHTKNWDLDEDAFYRIRVVQGNLELAIADVQITSMGTGRNARSGEFFSLKDGTTLPIKVRIEEGAGGGGGSEDGKAAIEVPAGAVDEYVEITVTPVDPGNPSEELPSDSSGTALGGTIYNFDTGTGELEFNEPVELSLAVPTTLPAGVPPTGLRVYFAGPNGWELLPGEVDLENGVVLGLTTHLSTFAILPSEVTSCDGSGFATLEEALAAVGPEGTITVCDGTHTVQRVRVRKPVTIEGEVGMRPTLTMAEGEWALWLNGTGSTTLRNLRIEADVIGAVAVHVSALHDQVLIEDVEFDLASYALRAISAVQSVNPGARTTIDRVTVVGGQEGIITWADPGQNSALDVLNSTFTGQSWNSIQYNFGSSGLVQGNTLSACGTRACIRVTGPTAGQTQVEPMRVIGNTITGTAANETKNGIELNADYGQTYEIRDNVIEGVAPASPRDDPTVYSFYGDGIQVNNANSAGVVSDNQISSANIGLTVDGGTVQATGLDNSISQVQTALEVMNGGRMAIHSSDFTNYFEPLTSSLGSFFRFEEVTCNWWGDAGGPEAVVGPINLGVNRYAPWAQASVAGSSTTTCTQPAVTFCPADGDPLTLDGMEVAVSFTDPGGTVTVCPGTHAINVEYIRKGVTIEGAAGGRPTLTSLGSTWGLRLQFFSGMVTLRNLELETAAGSGAVLYGNHFDQVLVDDVEFSVLGDHAALLTRSSVPGARAVFQYVTISGGDPALFIAGSGGADGPFVDILNSTFNSITPGFSVIQYQNGATGRIEGNLIDGCEKRHCIRVSGGGGGAPPLGEPVKVIGNTIRSYVPGASQNGIAVNAVDFEVRDNILDGVTPIAGDLNEPANYSFTNAGLSLSSATVSGTVSGNAVESAFTGIRMGGGTVQVTGLDNAISDVNTGVEVVNGGLLALHSSDFTSYIVPIGTTEPFGLGDLTCNWWGVSTGPAGVDLGILVGVFTPWALASVAGTSTTVCSGGS